MFNTHLYKIAIIIINMKLPSTFSNECEATNGALGIRGGILGEVRSFPWLGVLRIPVRQDESTKIAATGVVLVSYNFVLVNADDVASLPIEMLRRDARVYFIQENRHSTTYKVKDVILHPEYQFATDNTLALLQLNLEFEDLPAEDGRMSTPGQPICWPGRSFNTSNELYIVGYTDERLLLEKVLYKGQYIPKTLCDEFYKRLMLKVDKMQEPKQFVCASTINHRQQCSWDNGMLLVSNATGVWTLVGFGVAGAGCSAPARFVDMSHYIEWVESAVSDPGLYDYEMPEM